jgi:hypothetical protein
MKIEGVLVWPDRVPVSRGWGFLAASKEAAADDDKKYDWYMVRVTQEKENRSRSRLKWLTNL